MNDCLICILNYLPITDLLNCSIISKQYNIITNNDFVWRQLFTVKFDRIPIYGNYKFHYVAFHKLDTSCLINYRLLNKSINSVYNLQELNLYNCHIATLPLEIRFLTNLRKIILSGNQLKTLPKEFGQLTNLIFLDLHDNKLSDYAAISSLTKLQILALFENSGFRNENKFKVLPEIRHLTNLRVLYLKNNDIKLLPSCIGNLTNLQKLDLHNNKPKSLPASIQKLTKLQKLYVGSNSLQHFPPIEKLTSLQRLDISWNKFKSFPDNAIHLTNLQRLFVCGITSLPANMSSLTNLQILHIEKKFSEIVPDNLRHALHIY